MKSVLACVDANAHTHGVCDSASWAARRLDAPLRFLHVLEPSPGDSLVHDISGNTGFDAEDTLLTELKHSDDARDDAFRRQAADILDASCLRAVQRGCADAAPLLRQGSLLETLRSLQDETRLVVLGQRPVPGAVPRLRLDHEVERTVRGLNVPVLITTNIFREPAKAAIAFDGSESGRRLIETLAGSPFLRDLPVVLLTAGHEHDQIARQQQWAIDTLADAGFSAEARHQSGTPEAVILDQVERQGTDLLIMGAYGHSRLREFVVGSVTTALLRTSPVPVLVLR